MLINPLSSVRTWMFDFIALWGRKGSPVTRLAVAKHNQPNYLKYPDQYSKPWWLTGLWSAGPIWDDWINIRWAPVSLHRGKMGSKGIGGWGRGRWRNWSLMQFQSTQQPQSEEAEGSSWDGWLQRRWRSLSSRGEGTYQPANVRATTKCQS